MPRLQFVLVLAMAMSLPAGTNAAAPATQPSQARNTKIVVLDEPRLPFYGAVAGASAEALVARLEAFGLQAEKRNAATIIADGLVDAGVFVTLHAQCYPQNIEEPLAAFQAAGGSLVSTGFPFSHAFAPERGRWRDLKPGSGLPFMQRLGFGLPSVPLAAAPAGLTVEAAGRRVGLGQFDWPRLGPVESKYLTTTALPQGTTCVPLLTLPVAEGAPGPVAALLRRENGGGPDAWALTLTLHDECGADREPQYIEIVARVVALVCEARGAIDLEARPLPPVPDALRQFAPPRDLTPMASVPRPPSDSIYPHAHGIAPTLFVADTHAWPRDERLLGRTVQGLANRETAQIWLQQKQYDPFWLAWLQERGDVKQVEQIGSLAELLKRFPPEGAVVYDPQQRHTLNIATMLAGVEGLVVATPALAEQHGLTIKHDLRGRFKTNAEAYTWAFENLWPRMSHQVLACVNPSPDILLHDYLVSQKVFSFWISGWIDGLEPGASATEEKRVLADMLQRMPVNIPVLGYPHAGDGIGIQERPGVNLLSRTGKFLVPSDYMPNLSVLSATRPAETPMAPLRQSPPRDLPLENDKVYVALTMSDGDNLNTYYDWFINDWRGEHLGKFPIGWTLGPSAIDFYPAVVDWYYRHATPHEQIQCAVSGIGYAYPDCYAAAFTDRARVVGEFCALTDTYMRRLDQRTMWVMGASGATFAQLAEQIPATTGFFVDYGRLPCITLDNAIADGANKPVFHVLADGTPGRLQRNLTEAVGTRRPAFVHAFLFNWDWRLKDVAALRKALPEDYVLVRPDELTVLHHHWTGD